MADQKKIKANKLTDNDLVYQIHLGDPEAFSLLFHKYQKYAVGLANQYKSIYSKDGFTLDELVSVALETFSKALKKFVLGKSTFYSYWRTYTLHAFMDYARANSYRFGARMFNGISLDAQIDDDPNANCLADIVGEEDEEIYKRLDKIELQETLNKFNKKLKSMDRRILKYLIQDKDALYISKATKLSLASVYYHITLIKKVIEINKRNNTK